MLFNCIKIAVILAVFLSFIIFQCKLLKCPNCNEITRKNRDKYGNEMCSKCGHITNNNDGVLN